MSTIAEINKVIDAYFTLNKSVSRIPAKDLMPYFIKAGIFAKDEKGGLPIRKILRKLDASNKLNQIPYVIAERKAVNTKWFFCRTKPAAPPQPKNIIKIPMSTAIKSFSRKGSDEHYVIDLCDEILGLEGSRQHKFDFLLGDPGKTGSRAKLPVDVYYEKLQLVIEFNEQQHSKAVNHFDKPNKITVSGVHRGEQRRIYDQRKKSVLPKHGIKIITISYDLFKCTSNGKLIRNNVEDMKKVKEQLKGIRK